MSVLSPVTTGNQSTKHVSADFREYQRQRIFAIKFNWNLRVNFLARAIVKEIWTYVRM